MTSSSLLRQTVGVRPWGFEQEPWGMCVVGSDWHEDRRQTDDEKKNETSIDFF